MRALLFGEHERAEAHRHSEYGHGLGKIVLRPTR
jgi:hypothetical protein